MTITLGKLAFGLPDLPLEAVVQRWAFLGRTGSGKSYSAARLAELMLDAERSPTSSGYANYLSHLNTNGLLRKEAGVLKAADLLLHGPDYLG